jgi:hypothetical protein
MSLHGSSKSLLNKRCSSQIDDDGDKSFCGRVEVEVGGKDRCEMDSFRVR